MPKSYPRSSGLGNNAVKLSRSASNVAIQPEDNALSPDEERYFVHGLDYTPDREMWNDRGNPEFWGIK